MFRLTCKNLFSNLQRVCPRYIVKNQPQLLLPKAGYSSKQPQGHHESDDDFDDRMVCYFSRGDIDGWELRKGLNDLAGMDLVPDPQIIIAALYACRRLDDYACTIRMLEMVKMKCGPQVAKIWPYILQEIGPALTELGVETPEQMGYDKPELALVDVYEV